MGRMQKQEGSSPMPRDVLQRAVRKRQRWPANRKHPCPGARPTRSSPVPRGVLQTGSPQAGQSLRVGTNPTA
eukprot:3552179-Alexandrium_andersonii.AAC.1